MNHAIIFFFLVIFGFIGLVATIATVDYAKRHWKYHGNPEKCADVFFTVVLGVLTLVMFINAMRLPLNLSL